MKKKIVRLFLVTLLATIFPTSSSVSAHILDGAKEWGGHYYKIFPLPVEWKNAKKFCENVGGHLATPETSAENEMLKQMFSKYESIDKCWIGGYCDNSKIWYWVTGKMITDYFDWYDREPFYKNILFERKYNQEDCKWTTAPHERPYSFICEWEKAEDAHESNL